MDLFEAALFRLCMQEKLSLAEAKALNAVRKSRAASVQTIALESGLDFGEAKAALSELEAKGIVSKAGDIFCIGRAEGKLLMLIDDAELSRERIPARQMRLKNSLFLSLEKRK
ncbi:Uncharacterised protein [uncultured archaeon]|nr:Uncharacterised protein [uncultured archaeon]